MSVVDAASLPHPLQHQLHQLHQQHQPQLTYFSLKYKGKRLRAKKASQGTKELLRMQVQPPNPEHKRMKRERKTIEYMTEIYCHNHHGTHNHELCPQCREFQEYAFLRLGKCPFQDKKSTCGKCTIHCYRPDMKEKVRTIMRYSGPRMLLSHPGMALHHAWDARRKPPTLAKREGISTV